MAKKKAPASIEVLIEHFDAKFNLLIDGYAALDKKIDEKIDELRVEMDKKFSEVSEQLQAIRDHLELHDDQFEVFFEELHSLRAEVTALKV